MSMRIAPTTLSPCSPAVLPSFTSHGSATRLWIRETAALRCYSLLFSASFLVLFPGGFYHASAGLSVEGWAGETASRVGAPPIGGPPPGGGSTGDAEYEEAKNELAFAEGRILTLGNLVNNAVIIDETHGKKDTVEVGATVTVKNPDGKKFEYIITGSTEADPSQGKVSNVSPIGKSLLGKKVGEITEVNAPSGNIKLEILSIL